MQALVREVDSDGAPSQEDEPFLEREADAAAPLGSIFKLYVLLAVSAAVDEGSLSWDDTLTVSDANRSLPSGELQDEPNGTEVTVREAATATISISDNTATDMLIQEVGRAAVEEAVAASGHHDPSMMSPFMSTREMFQVGWGREESLQRWIDGSTEQRRGLLEELERAPIGPHDIAVGGDPLWPQGVEWFATAEDLAAVHVALQERDDPVVREVLSANAGVDATVQEEWDYLGFKGGSSPGVLTGSWVVEQDDRRFVVVIQTATDEAAGIGAEATSEFTRLATTALELTHQEASRS